MLLGGKAAAAAQYPQQLCEAIVHGCQMGMMRKGEAELNLSEPWTR